MTQRKKSLTPLPSALASFAAEVKDGDLRTAMGLDNFMMQVGIVMRLPSRKEGDEEASSEGASAKAKARPNTRWWLPAAAALAALVGAWQLVPRSAPSGDAPEEVVGTWRAIAPGYAGRSVTIQRRSLEITVGDTLRMAYPIERVTGTHDREGSRYVIHYRTSDGLVAFPLIARGAVIELPNPKGAQWTREK